MPAWGQPAQLTAIIAASLALHLVHAAACAGHAYLSIGVGLRGLRRVRDDVFGWLQRLSLRYHHGTEAGDIIFRAGTDTCAFQILFLQGLLIFISATGTLLFMAVAMAQLNLRLTAVALVAVPILLAVDQGLRAGDAGAGHWPPSKRRARSTRSSTRGSPPCR